MTEYMHNKGTDRLLRDVRDNWPTPGEWTQNGNAIWSDACKDRGYIAECKLATGTHVPANQNEINARLIAAAPRLLAACKEMLSDLSTDTARHAMSRYYSPLVWRGRIETARAAIAKAEGKP